MCIAEGSLALDTPQNKSRLRLLFRAYEKQTNNVEVNSALDWSQTLARGCQFTLTYTFVFLTPQITGERSCDTTKLFFCGWQEKKREKRERRKKGCWETFLFDVCLLASYYILKRKEKRKRNCFLNLIIICLVFAY